MKKLALIISVLYAVACSHDDSVSRQVESESVEKGVISVAVEYEDVGTKALTDYTTELSEEKMVNSVKVLVFDKSTGALNAYSESETLESEYSFSVPAGEKTLYAVVNGPDMSQVKNLTEMKQLADNLAQTKLSDDGLVMIGNTGCTVNADAQAKPVITVRRLVSRVVLQKITNSIPSQYGSMTVNCVYLGNANTVQTLGGTVSARVNPDGYSDIAKSKPIGQSNNQGSCPGYLYRSSSAQIASGASSTVKYHMYCQPNSSQTVTCLYLLVTIAGNQYYYRVPLSKGLVANTTSSIEIDIVNLGASLPPDGDMQKGEIVATVNIAGWDAGEAYDVEF